MQPNWRASSMPPPVLDPTISPTALGSGLIAGPEDGTLVWEAATPSAVRVFFATFGRRPHKTCTGANFSAIFAHPQCDHRVPAGRPVIRARRIAPMRIVVRRSGSLSIFLTLAATTVVFAQAWPSKQVTLLVPF